MLKVPAPADGPAPVTTSPGVGRRPTVRSSYASGEVEFLLTDLSDVALERDTAEREAAIQAGRNYAEMLPVEYAPPPDYLALFDTLMARTARRTAELVGLVCEQLLDARGPDLTLVSLARAGTPVGILMRRWFARRHGLEPAHYAVSIVRGVGLDHVALAHVTARHDPAGIAFVDGWTGKGAIATELSTALHGTGIAPALAVLTDPGRCAGYFGSRGDELIASACLNATVCGLVSRTVYNRDLLGPGDFHGAKHYAELAPQDRSAMFLDSVSDCFPAVEGVVEARWRALRDGDRAVDFAGAQEVRRLQREHGLASWHLVKPGVGETTRVLLRRLPWKVLVHPDARADLAHVFALAADRDVPVLTDATLRYACVGLIAPHAPHAPAAGIDA